MDTDDDLFKRIVDLENQVRGLKSSQPIGTDSVQAYTTQTNNIWDAERTLPVNSIGIGNGSQEQFLVTFEARNQQAPFAKVKVFVADGNGQPVPYYSNEGNNVNLTGFTIKANDYIFYSSPNDLANPKMVKFLVTIGGIQYTPYKVKFLVDATDYGRMTVTIFQGGQQNVVVP